jgi:hypothetical protein
MGSVVRDAQVFTDCTDLPPRAVFPQLHVDGGWRSCRHHGLRMRSKVHFDEADRPINRYRFNIRLVLYVMNRSRRSQAGVTKTSFLKSITDSSLYRVFMLSDDVTQRPFIFGCNIDMQWWWYQVSFAPVFSFTRSVVVRGKTHELHMSNLFTIAKPPMQFMLRVIRFDYRQGLWANHVVQPPLSSSNALIVSCELTFSSPAFRPLRSAAVLVLGLSAGNRRNPISPW